MIQPWPTVRSEFLGDFRVFRVRKDYRRSPRTGGEHDFMVVQCPGWVNVIALTPANEIVLVEQYRHGTQTVDLEIPGGVMDPEDASPLEAGLRELREETGYEGTRARLIGSVATNPAFMDNRCHTVLVEGCELKHGQELDHTEDVATHVVPLSEIPALVASGRIHHSLVLVAFYHLDRCRAVEAAEQG